jgi:hypothetical protein
MGYADFALGFGGGEELLCQKKQERFGFDLTSRGVSFADLQIYVGGRSGLERCFLWLECG